MTNINAFRTVIHEKKMLKVFCYTGITICPSGRGHFFTPGSLNGLESPVPKDTSC